MSHSALQGFLCLHRDLQRDRCDFPSLSALPKPCEPQQSRDRLAVRSHAGMRSGPESISLRFVGNSDTNTQPVPTPPPPSSRTAEALEWIKSHPPSRLQAPDAPSKTAPTSNKLLAASICASQSIFPNFG